MKLILKYTVVQNDSDWMSSDTLENEEHILEVQNKTDIINFLKSLEYVDLNLEIMKELESDNDFNIGPDFHKIYSDSETDQWVCSEYTLILKAY